MVCDDAMDGSDKIGTDYVWVRVPTRGKFTHRTRPIGKLTNLKYRPYRGACPVEPLKLTLLLRWAGFLLANFNQPVKLLFIRVLKKRYWKNTESALRGFEKKHNQTKWSHP